MAKQKNKSNPHPGTLPAPKLDTASGYEKYFLPLALLLTLAVYLPSLNNKFVNLDDTQYVLENPVIKEISSENLKAIFSEQFVGNYQPLTMLSYMLNYKFSGLDPFGYHFVNLIFHLLGTWLVFLIIKKLSGNGTVALLTALLFGIHPLHVESVAWVSERKDVLYGFFFLWALYLYVDSRTQKDMQKSLPPFRAGAILLLFLLSLLCKAQAVVLPVVFFAVDLLMNRKFSKRSVIEKIPFFLLAVAFGLLAIQVQGKAGAMQTFQYFPFYERVLFSCYALMTYLHKLILPMDLSCFYPYPETDDKINTVWVYLSPAVLLALAFIIWKYFRSSKVVLFGAAFFLLTIVLVLQLLPIGDALYADRYTYLPSIGLFFIAAHYVVPHLKNKLLLLSVSACLAGYGYFSFQRSADWHDSITLYTDAIDHGYKAAILYNNRGAVLADSGKNEEALKDFEALVTLKPRYPNGWRHKGLLHMRLKQEQQAVHSFSEAIKHYPGDFTNYLSRGTIYVRNNDFENALKDFTKIIELQPSSGEGYYARSEAYGKSNRLPEALADINKAIEFAPDNGQAYNNRGIINSMRGKYQEAVNDFTRSLELKPDNVSAYSNRSLAYKSLSNYEAALKDALTAKEKGGGVDEKHIQELQEKLGNN